MLLMDETTSHVDKWTDEIMQHALGDFHNTTIISIAHQLHPVLDSDRIAVVDNGRCASQEKFWTPLL
ncbi:hypothetical protein EYZ11_010556 [Aspergillus tanneri]|uniref:Multidrug resistance-associated protein 4 n=1 Tax=Aspergillus tanneri TaxID=1220188 RepID=A0A4S3J5M2_9EURO|nr:Multidrug resistance-associated protein 4 [Aspergillus tanneri]KAA8647827.1 Multidrug resistance-associated protein 4 [Aspergillus tanneri]THC89982.1 hypothetical protein EYZ11_010556 [Aspergillus tanneri]